MMSFRFTERTILSNKTCGDGQSPETGTNEVLTLFDMSTASEDPWEWQSLFGPCADANIVCRNCELQLSLLVCLQPETAPSFAYLYTRNLPLPGSCLRQTPSFWASPGASQLKQKWGGDEEIIFWLRSHKRIRNMETKKWYGKRGSEMRKER